MKLLVINQPLRNHGDEAAHRAFIAALSHALPSSSIRILFINERKEDIEAFRIQERGIEYVSLSSAGDPLFFKVTKGAIERGLSFDRLLWRLSPTCRLIMREFRQSDRIICAPGGTCLGIQQNWMHLIMLRMAVASRKSVAYWGRSIGPFPEGNNGEKRFKTCALKCLQGCGFISLRDRVSMQIASQMGINAIEVTDSAFLQENSSSGEGEYCVFVPNVLRSMAGFKDLKQERSISFFSKVLDIILSEYSGKVIMLPQLFGQGEWNDEPFFKSIAAGRDRVVVFPDSCSSDEQQRLIKGADFMVGARYHSMVFAINNSTPFIAFSYEHKISGLLEILDLQDHMIDLQKGAFSSADSELDILETFRQRFSDINNLSTVNREVAARKVIDGFKALVAFLENDS